MADHDHGHDHAHGHGHDHGHGHGHGHSHAGGHVHAPASFGATFAIGYAVVTLLHSWLFIYGSSDREAAAMLSITPFNVAAAALLLE